MKKLAILILVALIGFSANAQTTKTTADSKSTSKQATLSTAPAKQATATTSTMQKVVIQTNGVCSKCEALFKENVPFFKGVKDYTYDPKTSKMTITYDSKKTNPDMLRQQISKLGYNADNVKADPAARAKLPACCQVDKKPGQAAGCCDHGSKSGCSGHNHGQCQGNHSQSKDTKNSNVKH